MPLTALVRQLQQVPLTGEVLLRLQRADRLRLSGAGRSARALVSSALAGAAEAPLLVLVPTLEEAGRWAALLELMGWGSAQLWELAILRKRRLELEPKATNNNICISRCQCRISNLQERPQQFVAMLPRIRRCRGM